MTTYAIGDVQGCYNELCKLLEKIRYDQATDNLWFAGDLVNRGPHSLLVLQLVKSLPRTIVVLGNHDLHLLSVIAETKKIREKDTFHDVLQSEDREAWGEWLRNLPFIHHDKTLGYTMVHAGIPPIWSIQHALKYSAEVEKILKSNDYQSLLKHMYGQTPDVWDEELKGWDRLRVIINYFTRMRFCTKTGKLDHHAKSKTSSQPEVYFPWFNVPGHVFKEKILFGHWAALNGETNVSNVFALDTGCVWGGKLSALKLSDDVWFNVESQYKFIE